MPNYISISRAVYCNVLAIVVTHSTCLGCPEPVSSGVKLSNKDIPTTVRTERVRTEGSCPLKLSRYILISLAVDGDVISNITTCPTRTNRPLPFRSLSSQSDNTQNQPQAQRETFNLFHIILPLETKFNLSYGD